MDKLYNCLKCLTLCIMVTPNVETRNHNIWTDMLHLYLFHHYQNSLFFGQFFPIESPQNEFSLLCRYFRKEMSLYRVGLQPYIFSLSFFAYYDSEPTLKIRMFERLIQGLSPNITQIMCDSNPQINQQLLK